MPQSKVIRNLSSLALVILLILTIIDLFQIAVGFQTLVWWGGFALSTATGLIFVAVYIGVFLEWKFVLAKLQPVLKWRNSIEKWRWVFFLIPLVGAIWFLQFSVYGNILISTPIRLMIGVVLFLFGGVVLSQNNSIISIQALTLSGLFVSVIFAAALDFGTVLNNPFSLSWSEGNRLWDYSLIFGKSLYDYPQTQEIFSYTDRGRQIIGGLPFILGSIPIWLERLWWGLLDTLLYAILGWTLFRRAGEKGISLLLLGLWTYVFINQGPIHAPLIVCAVLVSLAWNRSYLISIFLLVIAGYFAYISRFTWIVAPTVWILILEFSETNITKTLGKTWLRPVILSLAGLTGSVFLPGLIRWLTSLQSSTSVSFLTATIGDKIELAGQSIDQGLLWYRLFPNATLTLGILPELIIALSPLILFLFHKIKVEEIKFQPAQALVLIASMLLLLMIGLVVSVKIGGGGDLHNLDMLFIALLFFSAVILKRGSHIQEIFSNDHSIGLQLVILALILIPGVNSLVKMKPHQFIFSQNAIEPALFSIQMELITRSEDERILFIDQRQLLTFGYIQTELFPEYEKKFMMDQALSGNQEFFEEYYRLLADEYYSLIISEPLLLNIKANDHIFGEENNAWVRWVSTPTLCFYQEIEATPALRDIFNVVMLVPKADHSKCDEFLDLEN